jgi:hypothetical protein
MWVILLFLIIGFTGSVCQNQDTTNKIFIVGKIFVPTDSEYLEYLRVEFVLPIDVSDSEKFFIGRCISTEKVLLWNKNEELMCFGRFIKDSLADFIKGGNYNSLYFSFSATALCNYTNENEKVFYFRTKVPIGEVEGFIWGSFPPKTIFDIFFDILIKPSKRFKFKNLLK